MKTEKEIMSENLNEIIQLVSFKLGVEEFGVEILKVQEINRMISITKIPNSPNFVDGVINLRGRVLPVINLRKKLGLKEKENDKDTRIIVVDLAGKTIGFIVDSVSEVLRIPKNITEEPPKLATGINSNYITSVAKLEDRLLILLDLEKVLLEGELETISNLA